MIGAKDADEEPLPEKKPQTQPSNRMQFTYDEVDEALLQFINIYKPKKGNASDDDGTNRSRSPSINFGEDVSQ